MEHIRDIVRTRDKLPDGEAEKTARQWEDFFDYSPNESLNSASPSHKAWGNPVRPSVTLSSPSELAVFLPMKNQHLIHHKG